MADKNGRDSEQAAPGIGRAAGVTWWEAGWLAWPGR